MKKIMLFILLMCSSVNAFCKITLSLDDAILVALRRSPTIENAKLSLLLQKLNVEINKWAFEPHYQLNASAGWDKQRNRYGKRISRRYNLKPTLNLKSKIGTCFSITFDNQYTDDYQPSLSFQLMQPLMRGFGKPVVEAMLADAIDNEEITKLTTEQTLRVTVTEVVNAYLDLLTAKRTLIIDMAALKRAQKSVQQTKKFIKAGHKAGNELITVKANVQSAKSQLENDKNSLLQVRFALLSAIGLDPTADVTFKELNIKNLIARYPALSLQKAKAKTLASDTQYQIDKLTLNGSKKRALLIAKNDARWQLNLFATARLGGSDYYDKLFNIDDRAESVGLSLEIPIDNKNNMQAIQSAKISLREAQIALKKEKWSKETDAINAWNSVNSAKRALVFAQNAEQLQQKTYQVSYEKYVHGLIDSLSLQSAQIQLIDSQQVLLNAQIGYLKSLVTLDLIIGNTLKTWHVSVRI